MSEIAALIERLEKAEAGSRELDAEIAATLRMPPPDAPAWIVDWDGPYVAHTRAGRVAVQHTNGETGVYWSAPAFTTSIDAALTLLPEGWDFSVDSGSDGYSATVWKRGNYYDGGTGEWRTDEISMVNRCQGPALALCIAALRARGARP